MSNNIPYNQIVEVNHSESLSYNIERKKQRSTHWKMIESHRCSILDPFTSIERRSRWSIAQQKTFTPIPITTFEKNLTQEQIEIIIRQARVDDIIKRLNNSNFEEIDRDLRSPSPDPIYDKKNVRINTFENRMKQKYNREKDIIIEELLELDKDYKLPIGWKRPLKQLKIYYHNRPDVNVTALIIGPKGITQKELQKKTKCKIHIKGDGSNTFDFLSKNQQPHLLIEGKTQEDLDRAKKIIEPLIDINSKEFIHFKTRHKMLLNKQYGVNTNEIDLGCEMCGQKGHVTWACSESIKANLLDITCALCHDKGHLTIDCRLFSNLGSSEDNKNNEIDEFLDYINTEVETNSAKGTMNINNSVLFRGLKNQNAVYSNNELNLKEDYENKTNSINEEIKNNDLNIGNVYNIYNNFNSFPIFPQQFISNVNQNQIPPMNYFSINNLNNINKIQQQIPFNTIVAPYFPPNIPNLQPTINNLNTTFNIPNIPIQGYTPNSITNQQNNKKN